MSFVKEYTDLLPEGSSSCLSPDLSLCAETSMNQ